MSWSVLWEGAIADVGTKDADELPEAASYGGSDEDHALAVAAFWGGIGMATEAGFARAKITASGHVATDPEPHGPQRLEVHGLTAAQDVELGGAGEHEGPVGHEQVIGPGGGEAVPAADVVDVD